MNIAEKLLKRNFSILKSEFSSRVISEVVEVVGLVKLASKEVLNWQTSVSVESNY